MYSKLKYTFGLFSFIMLTAFEVVHDVRPIKILSQMNDSIKNIKTLRVNISALERLETGFNHADSEIKLQSNPKKLYFRNTIKKIEILYNSGKSNNKAIVKPNAFPFITLALDPSGNLMRKNQHYTIHELGFEFIGKSVSLTISKDKEGLNNFKNYGKVLKNGFNCYLIEYENKNFGYIDYVVGEKETVSSIASKFCVNDYLIRYKNDLLNDYGYIKHGKTIKIPNLYCKKATLYIDEKLMLPVVVSLFDDVGVFENYEFSKIEINKPIKEEEFLRTYKDYHF
jgi:hypothetical protein